MSRVERWPYPQPCGPKLWIGPYGYRELDQSGQCRCRGTERPPIASPVTGRPGFAHRRPICTSWGKLCGFCGEKQVALGLDCGRRGVIPILCRSSAALCPAPGEAHSERVLQVRQLSPASTQPMTTSSVKSVSNLRQVAGQRTGWGQADGHGQGPASLAGLIRTRAVETPGVPRAVHRGTPVGSLSCRPRPGGNSRRRGSFRRLLLVPTVMRGSGGSIGESASIDAAHCRTCEIGKTGAGARCQRLTTAGGGFL